MGYLKEWRGHDISRRCEKIERASRMAGLRGPEDFPVIVNAPCYFGFGDKTRLPSYWEDPAEMVRFQENGFEEHLKNADDDAVPYFMPWFGTGVLASAFGCPYQKSKGRGEDPSIVGRCINSPKDIAKLKMPDPHSDGWMPKVLKTMEYARRRSDLPVGLTDLNSPLSTAAQMCGYDSLFLWMYDEPEAVRDLLSLVTDSFIEWVKQQKSVAGEPLNQSNGLQGWWAPEGIGVWLSDDDIVTISPELYEEFIVPQYSRIFEAFGGGCLHFCGNAANHADAILKIKNLRAVNNSVLLQWEGFEKLAAKLHGKVMLQIQDIAYVDMEDFLANLFCRLNDLRGVMIAAFALDNCAKTKQGEEVWYARSAFETCREAVSLARRLAAKKMGGL